MMTTKTMTMTTIEMMTMTKHASKGRQGAADKIWAVGLAGATCAGLVGVVGVRVAEDAVASTPEPESVPMSVDYGQASAPPVSPGGLTEAQLDQYAQALAEEAARLEAYHAELLDVAARLQESVDALDAAQQVVPASSGPKTGKAASAGKSSNAQEPSGQAAKPSQPAPAAKPAEPAKPAPAAKPVPKPAAAPQVAAPQAQTRGS